MHGTERQVAPNVPVGGPGDGNVQVLKTERDRLHRQRRLPSVVMADP